ncbi:hypothetical protein A9Q84_04040 [Halobacteriovorax marinus]|uniref:Type III pantothenate kinase n=1 Tax=Halobacteriovorax marinus TaxID=97084 RepID=A0A1Y5FG06_9BACT|nr:hypothetical protein A9Q84_04040 [Halobacteriovorax marinus]
MLKKNLQSIDNGNTNPHVGLFIKGELTSVTPLSLYTFDSEIESIASSVGPEKNLQGIKHINLKEYRLKDSFLDMPVNYEMALGEDRLHQGYYIFNKREKGLSVLIDAGTFTTVDFISEEGLKGGFIFPGLQTFLNSYSYGEKLPTLETTETLIPDLDIPHSTSAAITNAMKYTQVSWLEKLLKDHDIQKIYLSGGYSSLFYEVLQDRFNGQIVHEENFIHYALFEIYSYIKR